MDTSTKKTWFTRSLLWSMNNLGWLIIIVMSGVIILGSQVGTYHPQEGSIHDIIVSYDTFGVIHDVRIYEGVGENPILVEEYYSIRTNEITIRMEEVEESLKNENLTSAQRIRLERQLDSYGVSLDVLEKELLLIRQGRLSGLTSITEISGSSQKFTWYGEYNMLDPSKIIKLATTDIAAWILAILLGVMSFMTKNEGNKIGLNRSIKDFWPTTMLHGILSSKLSPHASSAEAICIELNVQELKSKRMERLQYVGLSYEDVFEKSGKFLNNPNFVKPEVVSYKDNKGDVKYRVNKYQVDLLKKQQKEVSKLKKYKIDEVHVHNLLEAKDAKSNRYDFGQSMTTRNRRRRIKSIFTSMLTMAPLITATWVFTNNSDPTMLIIAITGIAFNFATMLVNIAASIAYVADVYIPNVTKRNDVMLEIGTNLGVVGSRELHWYELSDTDKRKGSSLDEIRDFNIDLK